MYWMKLQLLQKYIKQYHFIKELFLTPKKNLIPTHQLQQHWLQYQWLLLLIWFNFDPNMD